MRKVHPSYEAFIREQKPKYGKTFFEWYAENYKIGDIDLLKELQSRNKYVVSSNEFFGLDETYVTYFKDFFSKKLQLCQNLIWFLTNHTVNYELNVVADIMDLYEDIIQEVCIKDNVYVCSMPNGIHNGRPYSVDHFRFNNFDELKEEMSTGILIVYYFIVHEDFSISIRYHKREPLTRTVLFEKEFTR